MATVIDPLNPVAVLPTESRAVTSTGGVIVAPVAALLGGTLKTGRTLNYVDAGDENRKMSRLFLSLMDRMDVTLDQFGDAATRLDGL